MFKKIYASILSFFSNKKDLTQHFVAHRGANNEAPDNLLPHLPENSIHSLREAYLKGAHYVECDIHLTKDNEIIVLHDDTIARTGRYNPKLATRLTEEVFLQIKDINVGELSYQNILSDIDIGMYADYLAETYRGTRIPLLKDFLFEIKKNSEKKLVIELKAGNFNIIPMLKKMLTHYIRLYHLNSSQLIFICFDLELITQLKKELPDHQHFLLTIHTHSDDGKYVDIYHQIRTMDDLNRIIQRVKQAKLDGINVEYDPLLIDTHFVKCIHKNQLKSAVWTYQKDDTLEMAEKMLNANVDLINTNQPEFIFNQLSRISERSL